MLVPNMTHEEVLWELAKDRVPLTRWWMHELERHRRRVLRCRSFPYSISVEHTTPSRNRYLIVSRIYDKRQTKVMTGVLALEMSNGMTVYTSWLTNQNIGSPMVMLPHMWRRYRERTGSNLSGIALVKSFFETNPFGAVSCNKRVFSKSVRYNGADHLACCVQDGVLLGELHGDLFKAKTFITYDMTCGLQQEVFEAGNEKLKIRKLISDW